MQEKIIYGGWPNCTRLSNDEIELVIATDIGPRIVHVGFINKQNFLYLSPDDRGKTGGTDWRLYGGHRLWLAPETLTLSYHPDNSPVIHTVEDFAIKLSQSRENASGIVKEMDISLSPIKNLVTVVHRLINQGTDSIEVAPWGITAMAPGGLAIIPNEPYGEGNDYLLPARSLALWQYTKMNDPRWHWGDKYIRARQDPSFVSEQKIGLLNKQEWAAYYLNEELLIKHFEYNQQASYPDFGSNNEVYINGNFLEIESLGPLTIIPPGGTVEHTENWCLATGMLGEDDASIDEIILPLVDAFKNDPGR
ncbi:MAG: hypothetical protein ABIQ31_16260 [Ferruginibacter sp.]